jgi:type I restriction enzyme M protein
MSEDQKRVLEQQLWNIANTLRGKMNDAAFGATSFFGFKF